ncbi:hypothetical protein D9M68_992290 [compost metagenome]
MGWRRTPHPVLPLNAENRPLPQGERGGSTLNHGADQRFAGEMGFEVGDEQSAHGVAGLDRGAALVGAEDDIVEGEEA